jgi:hypothetical protein
LAVAALLAAVVGERPVPRPLTVGFAALFLDNLVIRAIVLSPSEPKTKSRLDAAFPAIP